MDVCKDIEVRVREEDFINIQAIQRGGVLTPEARKALIAYGDGYSVCDFCLKPFRLDKIQTPPVGKFIEELAKFVGMDEARVVRGARDGFRTVMSALLGKGDIVLVTELSHYTMCLAAESVRARWMEIPKDKNNIINAENAKKKIEEVKKKEGKLPKLVAMEHFDYQYGNEHQVKEIAKISHDYGIPFMYNGAYSVGIMPVDGKKLGADFVVGSGHKSMAAPAPTGVLAATKEWAEKVFATTALTGDVSGRKFGIKETQLLGCTVMGAPLVAMMASFPTVKERVTRWPEELKKINHVVDTLHSIEGTIVESECPRKNTLTKVDSTGSFDKVAQTHKDKGFFLYKSLKKRGIVGPFAGATRDWKFNTYGLSWDQIRYLADSFQEIAKENGLRVHK